MCTFIGMNCIYRHIHIFVLLLALSIFASCASRQTAVTLDDVETYIKAHPDSALVTIRAIDTTTLNTRSLRAHYALLHAMALDKNWIDTTDVNVVMPAVEYYDRHPSGIRRAKAWYYLGRIQQNGGNRPDASISFLKAERYAESSDDSDFKGLIALAMSTIYCQTHLHEEALKYAERAYSFFVEARDTTNANNSLYCKASVLMNLERYGEADSLFRILIENESVHPNLRASLFCNYALNLVIFQEDYEQAVNTFEKAITTSGSLKNRNSWGAYAYSLLRVGRAKRADSIFAQLESTKGDAYLSFSYWKSMADAYSLDYPAAFQHLKTAYDIQDENVVKAFRQSAIKAQKDFLEQVNQKSERRLQVQRLTFVVIILVLAIVLGGILLAFRRKREKEKKESERLVQLAEDSARMLQQSNAQLFRNQFAIISDLCKTYFKTEKGGEARQKDAIYLKVQDILSNISSDDQLHARFEAQINHDLDGIIDHLKADLGEMNPTDERLLCYMIAGFDSSTIAAILDLSLGSVYTRKSRLKDRIRQLDSPYKGQYESQLLLLTL